MPKLTSIIFLCAFTAALPAQTPSFTAVSVQNDAIVTAGLSGAGPILRESSG